MPFEPDDQMITTDGQVARGVWTDGVHTYGWLMVHEAGEDTHWKAFVWDRAGREYPADFDQDKGRYSLRLAVSADGEPMMLRRQLSPDQLRAMGVKASKKITVKLEDGVHE